MRIVCAGGALKQYSEICVKNRAAKLYSILNERSHLKRWTSDELFLMVDSGAHSWNKFSITKIGHASTGEELPPIREHAEKYLQYIYEHKNRPWVFVELDVYGHETKEYIDQMYYRAKAIKGNFEFIRVYHPMLDGGSCTELKKWIDEGQTYIGIGNDSIPILNKIFSMTKDKVKIHGFAMTKFDLCRDYPFYSVDSTSPLAGEMYGCKSEFGLRNIAKKKCIEMRDPHVFRDRFEAMDLAVKNIKKTEAMLTELWRQRGVIWHDRYEPIQSTFYRTTGPSTVEL